MENSSGCLTFTFAPFTLEPMTKLAEQMSGMALKDAALAAAVGCDRSMVTKLRHGKATPSLSLALAISRETGVEVADLMPAPIASGEAA